VDGVWWRLEGVTTNLALSQVIRWQVKGQLESAFEACLLHGATFAQIRSVMGSEGCG
jgi:hypothetical protein